MRTKSTNTPMSWVRNQHTRHILHYRHQTEYIDEPSSRSRRVRRRAQRSLGNQILINLYRDQRDKGSDNSFLHQIDMAHHHSMASMSPSSGCQSVRVSKLSVPPRSQNDLGYARPDEAPNYIGIHYISIIAIAYFLCRFCEHTISPRSQPSRGRHWPLRVNHSLPIRYTHNQEYSEVERGPNRIAIILMSSVPQILGPRGTDLQGPVSRHYHSHAHVDV